MTVKNCSHPIAHNFRTSMYQFNSRLEILAANCQALTLETPLNPDASPNGKMPAYSTLAALKPMVDKSSGMVPEVMAISNDVVQTWATQKSLNMGLGILSLQSTTKAIGTHSNTPTKEKDPNPTRKSFTVRFLCRFTSGRRGFRISANDSFDHWTFNTIRRRPWNSEIFVLCRVGNINGVKRLLDYGEASVFDVDDHGDSPLHVSSIVSLVALRRLTIFLVRL